MKMKNTQLDNDSENEFDVDEPDEIQNNASDDDWTPEATGRRQSRRLRGSARPTFAEVSSSEEELSEDEEEDDFDSEEENRKRRSRQQKRGRKQVKRARVTSTTHNENSDSQQGDGENKSVNNSDSEPTSTTSSTKLGKEFSSGSFVVLKTDLANITDPPLWKIDGKALLQKYIPFEQDGKTYYKNTSVYSGWTVNNKDQYYAATVIFKQQNRKEHIIEFQKDLIKNKKNKTATSSDAPKSPEASKSPTEAPKSPEASKSSPEASKSSPEASKSSPEASKSSPEPESKSPAPPKSPAESANVETPDETPASPASPSAE